MRTCPACGESTDAGMTEPCTECGFSPTAPEDAEPWDQSSWAQTQQPNESPEVTPAQPEEASFETVATPAETPAEATSTGYGFPDEPAPPPAEQKSRPGRTGLVWIVVIVIGIALNALDVFGGCGEILGEDPGPTAEETEAALTDDAAQVGLQGATVECPDDAAETEADATFTCTVTAASGASSPITVTNREDSFEWSRAPFIELKREGPATPDGGSA